MLEDVSIIAWLDKHGIKTENGKPYDLKNHKFWYDPIRDLHPKQVWLKAAQVGGSLAANIKLFWCVKKIKLNVIYTLPTASDRDVFVKGKTNPLIGNNEVLTSWINDTDSVEQKQLGANTIYFRGTWTERAALSVTSDLNIYDELDRCFASPVDVLTKDGWKDLSEITVNDKVATRNYLNVVVYKNPTEVIKMDYTGDIYRLKGRGVNVLLTPNHRLFARAKEHSQFQGAMTPYRLWKIKDLIDKPFVITSKARFTYAGNKDTVNIPYWQTKRRSPGSNKLPRTRRNYKARPVPALAFYRFMGWYLTEGSVVNVNQRATGGIVIVQKDQQQVNEIKECIEQMGFNPKVNKNTRGISSVVFHDLQFALFLKSLGKSKDKYLPKRYLSGKKEWLAAFLAAAIKGDGDERNVISTLSKKLADNYQIIAVKLGKSATISTVPLNDSVIYRTNINQLPYKRVNGYRGSSTKTTVTKESFTGTVRCLEIENETFLVRDKDLGRPFWSGNSKKNIIEQYASRLQHSDYGWEWAFSNPSTPGHGVSAMWEKSDKRHWFITCKKCQQAQYLDFPDSICMERQVFQCKACKSELRDEDRRDGNWRRKIFDTDPEWHGYWFSLLMNPKVPATKIISLFEDKAPDYFHNFVLGLPYAAPGGTLTDSQFWENLRPEDGDRKGQIVIGVDTGLPWWYVIGNQNGAFESGHLEGKDDLERLLIRYPKAIAIIDAGGDLTAPRELRAKYPGRIKLCYYRRDRKEMGIITPGTGDKIGQITVDRNKMIQALMDELRSGEFFLRGSQSDWEELRDHVKNMYRVAVEDKLTGRPVFEWVRSGPDHLFHALVYFRAGIEAYSTKGGGIKSVSSGFDSVSTAPGIELDPLGRAPAYVPSPKTRDWRDV